MRIVGSGPLLMLVVEDNGDVLGLLVVRPALVDVVGRGCICEEDTRLLDEPVVLAEVVELVATELLVDKLETMDGETELPDDVSGVEVEDVVIVCPEMLVVVIKTTVGEVEAEVTEETVTPVMTDP